MECDIEIIVKGKTGTGKWKIYEEAVKPFREMENTIIVEEFIDEPYPQHGKWAGIKFGVKK